MELVYSIIFLIIGYGFGSFSTGYVVGRMSGHNIQSEISENENMRARGIKCVIQETRELDGVDSSSCDIACGGDCGSCSPERKREAADR